MPQTGRSEGGKEMGEGRDEEPERRGMEYWKMVEGKGYEKLEGK